MNKKDIKSYLAPTAFSGLLVWSLVFPVVKNIAYNLAYREFQISRAPIYAVYTKGPTWTLEEPYSWVKGGLFDRDGDGNYDEVIEIGTATTWGTVWRLRGIATSRALHPGDEEFQERLELLRKSQNE